MKANELRIGNLIQWISTGSIERVLDIHTFDKRQANVNNVNISDCLPIPLTEEWLLKLGFKDVQRGFYSIKAGSTFFRLTPPQFMGEWQTEYCWVYDDFKFTEVKYVHQLQNLYFALTGNELTIKDNGST